jgi:hypothetical protein
MLRYAISAFTHSSTRYGLRLNRVVEAGSALSKYSASPSRDALARARPVGEPGVARAIGQAFDRGVAAKTEILGARGADRPAASLLAQLEQRAAVSVVNRLVVGRLRLGARGQQYLTSEPSHRSRAVSLRGILSRRASPIAAFFAR